jgi:hypothetical protein
MIVEMRLAKETAAVLDYLKFLGKKREFWETCADCYCFNQQTHAMDIGQCVLANNEYIVRNLEFKIVESVRNQLLRMDDLNQRQQVCLILMDANGDMLFQKPKDWNLIKNRKFMIINGQHSIIALQELQIGGYREEQREALARWDAYIVWSKEPKKL